MSAAVPQPSRPKPGRTDWPRHFAYMASKLAKAAAGLGRRIGPMHCAAALDTWGVAQPARSPGDLR